MPTQIYIIEIVDLTIYQQHKLHYFYLIDKHRLTDNISKIYPFYL